MHANMAARKAGPSEQENDTSKPAGARRLGGVEAPRRTIKDAIRGRSAAHFAPQSGMDRNEKRRIKRGQLNIAARLDLHGFTARNGEAQLKRFILASIAADHRLVLVITGRGHGGEGILRRSLPQWLSGDDLRRHIVAFERASPEHGGDGAFYVRLRRADKIISKTKS